MEALPRWGCPGYLPSWFGIFDSLCQPTVISYSQRQELLEPGGCLGLSLVPFLNQKELSDTMIPFPQVPNYQTRLAGVPTPHHQSHFLRIRGKVLWTKERKKAAGG